MSDEIIECVDCGRRFIWSYGEQRYYRERGLSAPRRCKECRARRRLERQPKWQANALYRFGLVTFGLSAVVAAVVWWVGAPLNVTQSWLIAINLVAVLTYAYDKGISSSGAMRVPENVLLALAAAGGIIGAVAGMLLFHHKTAKGSFQLKLLLVAVIQSVLIVAYLLITH